MSAKWKQFSKEQLQEMANQVKSNAAWLRLMGYAGTGGNSTTVVNNILEAYPDIDISHFTGQVWNAGNTSYDKLTSDFKGKRSTIKRALESIRGHKCECCGLSEWNGAPIALEVHHCNGNNQDNDVDNLLLLCPNCHAQTEFYRGKNIIKDSTITDEDFLQALKSSSNIRQALLLLGLTPKGGNYSRAYKLIKKYNLEHLK